MVSSLQNHKKSGTRLLDHRDFNDAHFLVFLAFPSCCLLGCGFLPVAIRAGLPAQGVAMTMNLFGHGIAFSGDFVIQGAPKLTADAAGLPVMK